MANGRMDNLIIPKPILDNIALGYSNDVFIGTELFPEVLVDSEIGSIPVFGKEAFKVYDTSRALRGPLNKTDHGIHTFTDYKMKEHQLSSDIDKREIEASTQLDLATKAINDNMQAIQLEKEWLIAEKAQTVTTYATDNTDTLTDNFMNESDLDPIAMIDSYASQLSDIIGRRPNTMIWGRKVWQNLKKHAKIRAYKSTAENQMVTMEDIKNLLEMEKFLVGSSRYSTDNETFLDVWGNAIILAYVTPPRSNARTQYDPCFGYVLKKKGYGGTNSWWDDSGKIYTVNVDDLYDIKVVGSASGFLIDDPIDPTEYAK